MRISWPWSLAFDVLAECATLAARQLCPMDHTGVRREQARAQAVLDAADALADAEAEREAWEANELFDRMATQHDLFRSPYVEPGDLISVAMPDGTIRTEYYRPASGMRSACGPYVQPEYFATSNCPGGCDCSCCYGYPDRDCHCFADPCNCGGNRAQHGQEPLPDSSRADRSQHAPSPGEVSSDVPAKPSLGDLTGTELLAELADVLETSARYATPDTLALIAEARTRVDLQPVSHEDLAAHITAIRNAWAVSDNLTHLSDQTATDLLSDYHITPK